MPDHERIINKNREETNKKVRDNKDSSQHLSKKSYADDQDIFNVIETPFLPDTELYTSVLSGIRSEQGKINFVRKLHQTYGNRYVRSLMESMSLSAKLADKTTVFDNYSPPGQQSFQRPDSKASLNAGGMGGLKPEVGPEEEGEIVGGRTVGEAIGDVARPVGTALGNVVGSVVGALTGVNISSSTNSGPTWGNHGHFNWRVGFSTTGTNGWIVQEIKNTYRAQDTAGNSVLPAYTPHYWEAWAVDGASRVTPNVGPNNDYWIRPSLGNNTQGHWSMTGSVYFTQTDPATQGFTPGGVGDAGILLSTTSGPDGLGIARLHRYAQGTWDSTGAAPVHTGSAS